MAARTFTYTGIHIPTGKRFEHTFNPLDSHNAEYVRRSNSDGLGAFTYAMAMWNRQGDGTWLYFPAEAI